MQICISILKGSKVMKSKAPNLEGLLQTPCEVLYLHLAPLTVRRTEGVRCKDEDKALLGDEERYSSSRVCGLSPRGASRPWLNRPTLKMEKCM
jgi:hypothetical protein